MNIENFTFSTRCLNIAVFETILTSKDGVKFGIIYQSMQPAPPAAVFEGFKQNKHAFFVDVDSVVTKRKPRKPSQKLLTNG